MGSLVAFRVLCGVLGTLFAALGVAFVLAFFAALAPGGAPPLGLPMGPYGVYFVAFSGTALVGWGGGLLGAARRPEAGRTVGTATAVALVLASLYRLAGWFMGDYAALGELLRAEAALFLLLALAFVWLRPAAGRPLAPASEAR